MVRGVEIGEIGRVMSVLAISISATEGSGVLMIANHGVGYAGWPKGDRGIELLGPLQGVSSPHFVGTIAERARCADSRGVRV